MKILKLLLLALIPLVGYLLLWPVAIDPQNWNPPLSPGLSEGPFASNDKLKAIERLADGFGVGPEAINVDAQGRIITGFLDGRVVRFAADGSNPEVLANTGGRPLGVTFDAAGNILVADARKGLLRIANGTATVLSSEADGLAFGFPDDADRDRSGKNIFFSDASSKFHFGEHMADAMEHGANGRLLRYNLDTQKTDVLMKNLHFANGIAVGPDDAYVLVNETTEYKITRYWLKGDKAGTHDVFADNLPGYPDNITFNGRDRFWVALFAPRDALLDKLLPAGSEWVRKLVFRLPEFTRPKPKLRSFAIAFDLNGKLVANLQYAGPGAYAPITSVREAGKFLYFGSLSNTAIGRLPLDQALSGQ
jgi:sugar lactone lactonase YvrE